MRNSRLVQHRAQIHAYSRIIAFPKRTKRVLVRVARFGRYAASARIVVAGASLGTFSRRFQIIIGPLHAVKLAAARLLVHQEYMAIYARRIPLLHLRSSY